MKQATLIRDEITDTTIRGTLVIDDRVFHVLERPWQKNQCNCSCIPAGCYQAMFLPETPSGKYRNVFELQAVPGRTGILIHSGNVVTDTQGCLIIGNLRGDQNGQPAVLESRAALAELVRITGEKDFVLTIEHCDELA